MKIETCYKYFEFLHNECGRYLKDNAITEEEIHQLKIEMDRFIEQVIHSDLPFNLKNKIADIKLDYTFNSAREYAALLGPLNFTRHRRPRKLKKMVEDLNFQIQDLLSFLKMNY